MRVQQFLQEIQQVKCQHQRIVVMQENSVCTEQQGWHLQRLLLSLLRCPTRTHLERMRGRMTKRSY
jgi:hypothetical protein